MLKPCSEMLLRRQVLPACPGLPGRCLRFALISACLTFAVTDAVQHWSPVVQRHVVLERIHEVPVPSLCESRHGVWQQCYRERTLSGLEP